MKRKTKRIPWRRKVNVAELAEYSIEQAHALYDRAGAYGYRIPLPGPSEFWAWFELRACLGGVLSEIERRIMNFMGPHAPCGPMHEYDYQEDFEFVWLDMKNLKLLYEEHNRLVRDLNQINERTVKSYENICNYAMPADHGITGD